MKYAIWMAVCLMFPAGGALAQCMDGGNIALYSDASGNYCNLMDYSPGEIRVYVVHTGAFCGVTGSRFRVRPPACATGWVWVSDELRYPSTTGTSQSGVTVLYGSQCRYSPGAVLKINFLAMGLTPPCCEFPIEHLQLDFPEPPEAFNCSGDVVPIYAPFRSTINGDPLCPCQGGIPVESATWGQVKALYRD